MTLNEFKRKYEKLSFYDFSEKCEEILGVRPPNPNLYDRLDFFLSDLREFEWKAMVRLENGGI